MFNLPVPPKGESFLAATDYAHYRRPILFHSLENCQYYPYLPSVILTAFQPTSNPRIHVIKSTEPCSDEHGSSNLIRSYASIFLLSGSNMGLNEAAAGYRLPATSISKLPAFIFSLVTPSGSLM